MSQLGHQQTLAPLCGLSAMGRAEKPTSASRLRSSSLMAENDFKPPKMELDVMRYEPPTTSGSPSSRCCLISQEAYRE
jgi:hypothetical protein